MFTYSSSETVLPTLTFTKAELVYALSVLMADIPPTDNTTRLELVELRHYLNKIKEQVSQASSDGTLKRAMPPLEAEGGDDTPKPKEAAPSLSLPSLAELKAQFPTLSESEIQEIIRKAKEEKLQKEREKKEKMPPPPSFIAKPREELSVPTAPPQKPPPSPPLTTEQVMDKKNSELFATLLGSF